MADKKTVLLQVTKMLRGSNAICGKGSMSRSDLLKSILVDYGIEEQKEVMKLLSETLTNEQFNVRGSDICIDPED